MGKISPLTLSEARSLRGGWFKWAEYMRTPDRSHALVYKLHRAGSSDILGIVSVFYNDGVVVDSLEIAPHSRRMPNDNRRYINLCDVMLAFAGLYGFQHLSKEMITMRKSWNNNFGVRLSLGTRTSSREPLEGLVVQPSDLSQRDIGSIMRAGKQRMMENHDELVIKQALSDIQNHIDRSDRKGARL